jgi:hypothetical protein
MSTLTDQQLAEIIDPERKREGWWDERFGMCPSCALGGTDSIYEAYRCGDCGEELPLLRLEYTGPPIATDDIAAFTHVVPVLLAVGYYVTKRKSSAEVVKEGYQFFTTNESWLADSLAPACAQAIAWLRTNDPERLARAVEATQ